MCKEIPYTMEVPNVACTPAIQLSRHFRQGNYLCTLSLSQGVQHLIPAIHDLHRYLDILQSYRQRQQMRYQSETIITFAE